MSFQQDLHYSGLQRCTVQFSEKKKQDNGVPLPDYETAIWSITGDEEILKQEELGVS